MSLKIDLYRLAAMDLQADQAVSGNLQALFAIDDRRGTVELEAAAKSEAD